MAQGGPPIDPGGPDTTCASPIPDQTSITQCGFDSVTVSVADVGCSIEWYIKSFGTDNGPLSTAPTFQWAFFQNDTILVRYLCDSSCITLFTSIPVKVKSAAGGSIALTPSSGATGQEITVSGGNLSEVLELQLNGVDMAFRRSGANLIFTVPPASESGMVTAITQDSTACTASADLTVTGTPSESRIANGTTTLCSALLTDPQGAGASYNNNQYITRTILPGSIGAKLQLDFTLVQLSDNDQLYVYNGTSAASPLLFRSVGGSTAPGKLVSTDASGALTVRFYSNGVGNAEGFEALASCLNTSTPGPIVSSLSSQSGVNGQKITISGMNLGTASQVRFGTMPTAFTVVNSQTLSASVPFGVGTGYVSVETPAGVAPSPAKYRITDSVKHFVGSTSICSGVYTDPQGPDAPYLAGLYQTMTIQPTAGGKKIMLDFSQFDIAAGDQMYIYDGSSASAPLLARYVGGVTATALDTVLAKGSGGAMTIRFYSDGAVQGQGWVAALSCVSAPVANGAGTRLGEAGMQIETFAFWPNPTKGRLSVRAENLQDNILNLFDTQGKLVYHTTLSQGTTEVSLPKLTPGLYLVRCGKHMSRLAVE